MRVQATNSPSRFEVTTDGTGVVDMPAWNDDPKPFVWTKTADEILDSRAGYRQRINNSGH